MCYTKNITVYTGNPKQMNHSRIDTQTLINCVRDRTCIWDSSDENYKYREMRSKAFDEVAAIVVPNFEKLSEARKKEAGKFTISLFWYLLNRLM